MTLKHENNRIMKLRSSRKTAVFLFWRRENNGLSPLYPQWINVELALRLHILSGFRFCWKCKYLMVHKIGHICREYIFMKGTWYIGPVNIWIQALFRVRIQAHLISFQRTLPPLSQRLLCQSALQITHSKLYTAACGISCVFKTASNFTLIGL